MAKRPYESPSSATEQILNLCWRIAVELRAVYNTAKARLTQAEADNLYLGKTAKAETAKLADVAVSADTAGSASQDSQGRVIASTYLTKADASATYLGKADKAASASAADTAAVATKATQDSVGNVIATTYAKKAEVPIQVNADWNATTGAAQIFNKPALGALATKNTVAYSEVTGTPSLGTLASMSALDYSSNYLINKPVIPTVSTAGKTGSYTDLINKPVVLSLVGYDAAADKVTLGKPLSVWYVNLTAGGRLTGEDSSQWKSTDVYAETYDTGSALHLRAVSSPTDPGSFSLVAKKADKTEYELHGDAQTGVLAWRGQRVMTSQDVSTAGKTGSYTDLSNRPAVLDKLSYTNGEVSVSAALSVTSRLSVGGCKVLAHHYTMTSGGVHSDVEFIGPATNGHDGAVLSLRSLADSTEPGGVFVHTRLPSGELGPTLNLSSDGHAYWNGLAILLDGAKVSMLPLATGGLLTGEDSASWKSCDLYARTFATGAGLHLRADDSPTAPGTFSLACQRAGYVCTLDGVPDSKTLYWNGSRVLTEASLASGTSILDSGVATLASEEVYSLDA